MQRGEVRNPYNIVVRHLPEKKLHEGQRNSERIVFELILKRQDLMVLPGFTYLQGSLVVDLVIFRCHDFSKDC